MGLRLVVLLSRLFRGWSTTPAGKNTCMGLNQGVHSFSIVQTSEVARYVTKHGLAAMAIDTDPYLSSNASAPGAAKVFLDVLNNLLGVGKCTHLPDLELQRFVQR